MIKRVTSHTRENACRRTNQSTLGGRQPGPRPLVRPNLQRPLVRTNLQRSPAQKSGRESCRRLLRRHQEASGDGRTRS